MILLHYICQICSFLQTKTFSDDSPSFLSWHITHYVCFLFNYMLGLFPGEGIWHHFPSGPVAHYHAATRQEDHTGRRERPPLTSPAASHPSIPAAFIVLCTLYFLPSALCLCCLLFHSEQVFISCVWTLSRWLLSAPGISFTFGILATTFMIGMQ